jgi:Spy/CpxP family protein refolding chaperone
MTTSPAQRRGTTRLKILLVLLGVFILGGVTGASLDSLYRLRGRHENGRQGGDRRGGRDNMFEHMRRDLNLSEQQATEIRSILDQTRTDYRALRTEVRPRYNAVRQQARTRIRALLTPEQQKLFDARAAERDARRVEDEEK